MQNASAYAEISDYDFTALKAALLRMASEFGDIVVKVVPSFASGEEIPVLELTAKDDLCGKKADLAHIFRASPIRQVALIPVFGVSSQSN
jgi:hypothetical protein